MALQRFACGGGELSYVDEGQGPAVVLLHGFPTSSYQWRELMPLLAGRFRVIAPDLLGSGESFAADGAELHIRAQASYIGELIADLGIDRFAVIGHATGGGIAQLLALDRDGADAMVLLDPVVFDAWPSLSTREAQARLAEMPGVPDPTVVEAVVRVAFDLGMQHRPRLSEAALADYVRPWVDPGGPERFRRSLMAIDGQGLRGREEELERIGFPVLILWGEDDPFLPATLGERLNDTMPSSTLGLLPGCGHFLTEEAPETIFPMIAEYLRARFLMEPHGHAGKEGVVMVQLERRPPWVDVAEGEADDWFDVDEANDDGED